MGGKQSRGTLTDLTQNSKPVVDAAMFFAVVRDRIRRVTSNANFAHSTNGGRRAGLAAAPSMHWEHSSNLGNLLRLLQLFCEGHFHDMQELVRTQGSEGSVNVSDVE